ncbi:MAG: acyl-CoA thioesterase II [Novosphingobium sp. 17-62-19]|uniref:acyl-CoA thioesterase n=1 Tax=Novosphingobium sp. 17-62-19 TaxID=1970406 RepID=UPI000BC3DB49|nr:acyl-CoA thioesterase II [Novosphingobium sp. 17-62-19]OZA16874.1 MAG: acyl-CoA thioesterase II [Novosphingobium sp. 17-62-19]HQS97991.1 acyl-CoA thioesterase II [Novosphingobium sp.]
MTDYDDPTPPELVSRLLELLDVKDHGGDRFEGRRKIGGVGRVFGGQVIGQALASAERTVPDDRPVHSLHAYFLRGGSEDHEIDFKVERDLDGGSFSNRRIVASQLGKPILNMVASFHKREEGRHHADPMPEVPGPEGLQSESELRKIFAAKLPEKQRAQFLQPRPIELRPVEQRHWAGDGPQEPKAHTWFRSVAQLPDDQRTHRAVLAFASDMTLLGTCTLPHDISWTKGNVMAASLDHAIWFHDDFRADEWLLYACDSPWAGRARGFNRGRIYTRDGRLVASVAQEGLIRPLAAKTAG